MMVFSYYVDRHADFPDAPNYLPMLGVLDRSCKRLGIDHVVLTDFLTAPSIEDEGIATFAMELPRNLMRATTECHARCLESVKHTDILFVGADCLIRKDPRGHIPEGDLAIILRPGHKRHRINNGFMFIPAASRPKVAPLYRAIADSTGKRMCDDMVAVERALAPMPLDYGPQRRAGITVNFLPMSIWNDGPKRVDNPANHSFVLHFRGKERKAIMLDWAKANGFA